MSKKKQSQVEFIALMAALMSIVALALDALLPALDTIGMSIGITDHTHNQLLITMFFLGLGIGPIFFGPISDSLGRKPMVYLGFAIFMVTSIVCVYAKNLEIMILGRILQGIGLSGPRTIAIAIIRDKFNGDYMARIMSFVTVVFLLIPVIAPAMGKLTLNYYNWQGIFYIQMLIGALVWLWFWKRQPETLAAENRTAFSGKVVVNGFAEVLKNKTTMAFTIISGFIVGSFLVYLSSSQQIFEEQYAMADEFPYIFAGLAIALGTAIFLNGSLVMRFGMKTLVRVALIGYFMTSCIYLLLFYNHANPSVTVLITFFALQFFAIGFLFGNLRALAMEPLGHIAGIGSAITGLIATLMAVPISIYIGKFVTTSSLPLFIGFASCSGLSLLVLFTLNRAKKSS